MMNLVVLVGNLGQDPEVKYLQNGSAVANLSVATTRTWKDKDGQKQEKTEWSRCVVFGKSAEFCGNYLKKGNKVSIQGHLDTRKWQNKDGVDMYTTEVVVDQIQNESPRSADDQKRNEPKDPTYGQHGLDASTGEEVPF